MPEVSQDTMKTAASGMEKPDAAVLIYLSVYSSGTTGMDIICFIGCTSHNVKDVDYTAACGGKTGSRSDRYKSVYILKKLAD